MIGRVYLGMRSALPLIALIAMSFGGVQVPAAEGPRHAAFEADEGWTNLIEHGLDRWVVERKTHGRHQQPADVWSVSEEGELRCDGRGFGFLRFDQEMADFLFACEYWLPAESNSGVGIRGVPYVSKLETRPSRAAYELQILDPAQEPDGYATGNMALYKQIEPLAEPARPAGEWNQLEVACQGPLIRVWLNGVLVQDVDQREHESIRDRSLKGYLQLQNHHSPVAFRNLRLKTLD